MNGLETGDRGRSWRWSPRTRRLVRLRTNPNRADGAGLIRQHAVALLCTAHSRVTLRVFGSVFGVGVQGLAGA
eukprot:COSAG04_NODE_25389_length_308_cov_0.746411_1_plen_72_part_10